MASMGCRQRNSSRHGGIRPPLQSAQLLCFAQQVGSSRLLLFGLPTSKEKVCECVARA